LSATKVIPERLAARRAKSNRHRAKGEGSATETAESRSAVYRFPAGCYGSGREPAARIEATT
jgi:hypothetical protein